MENLGRECTVMPGEGGPGIPRLPRNSIETRMNFEKVWIKGA